MGNYRGTIGILTGGGDVPGLNSAIRGVTVRAIREGFRVIGIRRGWGGLTDIIPDRAADNGKNIVELNEEIVNRNARTGGTFLHTSRTRPSHLPKNRVPEHLIDKYTAPINDVTPEILKNLEFLGIDFLIPIGGDDTLSYAQYLHQAGAKVVAIPKTMDNDVPGTDYCIGFSTCVTRTLEMLNALRTTAGSHERLFIVEVMGRYAGFTAIFPTLAGAADRCIIPEYPFKIEHLTELLVNDRKKNLSHYAFALVSEGAQMVEDTKMVFEKEETDQYGHKKLGGIADRIAERIKKIIPNYLDGEKLNVDVQRLGYLVRSGEPDSIDSVVPMVFGNLALDLVLKNTSGRLVGIQSGKYANVPISEVVSRKKLVNVEKYYNKERLRPKYESFNGQPLMIMTMDD
jgi:6-phosphofructokinase